MKPKKKDDNISLIIDILILIFITPLIFSKILGDGIISFTKSSYFIINKAYRILWRVFRFLKSVILIILKTVVNFLFFLFRRHKKIIIGKKGVIFSKKKRIFVLPGFPKIRVSFLPRQLYRRHWFTSGKLLLIKLKYLFIGLVFAGIIGCYYFITISIASLPNPSYLTQRDIPATTKIYDRNNILLYEIYSEENRTLIPFSQIPEMVKKATIAIEDKEFFLHKGYSPKGIIRALFHNLNSDSLEGGSTITQQLIRSALLTPEKTFSRKIKEIILSIRAEQLYSKEQILEMYLNQVPYGGTAWGIEAAAQTYFGKPIAQLSLAEIALLAGLPAAPSRYSPFGPNTLLAKRRQEEVLDKMYEAGFIPKEQMEEAKTQPLVFNSPRTPIKAPHFVMYVRELLEEYYGPRIVEKGGLRVTTTLDLPLQELTQKIVSSQAVSLKQLNVGNGAALITNPKNGDILAMVGSYDYFDTKNSGNVNLTTALRQPGSSIKVVNYAAALKSTYFTAASILDDAPVTYKIAGQPSYTPVNYDGKYHGKVTLRIALASSYNIPAVKVLSSIGVKSMIEQGKLMGVTSWNDETRFGLSLTLGGGEVTMVDMAKVYGTLANNGKRADVSPFIKITNWQGETLPLPTHQDNTTALPPSVAFIISNILSDNNARTPAFGSSSALVVPGKTVAVKTGTSDNKRDNWTIGYTQDYVTTVWVGNNDNSPMNPQLTSGVTGAAPIWNEIMKNILTNKQDKPFAPPPDVVGLPCYQRIEYFIKGTQPKGGCIALPSWTPKPTQ